MKVGQLWHTVRWLRPGQLASQLRHRLIDARRAPRLPQSPPFPGVRWQPEGLLTPPGAQRNTAEALQRGEFVFLNETETLGFPPRDWEPDGLPRLWLYNLHYFEMLWPLPFDAGRQLVLDWIARHGPALGHVGWEPYPISLRLENLCAYFFGMHRAATLADVDLRDALWESIHAQASWLEQRVEWHLMGNHLFENAAALAFVGACFDGDAAERWLRRGISLLERELGEQVLADGGHFERSPLYQARIVWLLQALGWTGDLRVRRTCRAPCGRMESALADWTHPDGEIALLNDAAFGIANPPRSLLSRAPTVGPFANEESGYFGARTIDGHYLICDAAPIGPDYIPGHAHGDMLSFELSFGGQRIVVDAGVFDYEPGEARRYCRSTAAHNTVEIDGVDQCEFWAAFRVARRGRPHDVNFSRMGAGFSLDAWHDGYERLAGRPRHERSFRWYEDGVLLVRDRVRSERGAVARSRLHFHPDCEVELRASDLAQVRFPGGECLIRFAGPGELAVGVGRHHPEFGVSREAPVLCLTSPGRQLDTGFCIALGAAALSLDLATGAIVDGTERAF